MLIFILLPEVSVAKTCCDNELLLVALLELIRNLLLPWLVVDEKACVGSKLQHAIDNAISMAIFAFLFLRIIIFLIIIHTIKENIKTTDK